MARKKTSQANLRRKAKANKVHSEPGAHPKTPPVKAEQLMALVQRHRDGDRSASWELGNLARKLLGHTEKKPASRLAIADLAERIGLIPPPNPAMPDQRRNESNLRQLMKFGRVANKRQAIALNKAGVAWRGVVYWIGVNDKGQRDELFHQMIAGLTNSTKIRDYIEITFKKKPLPRLSGDCGVDFSKAQNQANSLASVLIGLCSSLDLHGDYGSARQGRQLIKVLNNTRQQINATIRKVRKKG